MNNLIGLKELRENVDAYVSQVRKGKSFIVVRRSRPLFRISPPDEEALWETVIDFTKVKKGGIPIDQLLARL